jgi:hypothetical protein
MGGMGNPGMGMQQQNMGMNQGYPQQNMGMNQGYPQQQNMGGMGNPGMGMQQPMQATVIDWSRGHLRIHPVECHLTHNTGGVMDRMDPFIYMRVG